MSYKFNKTVYGRFQKHVEDVSPPTNSATRKLIPEL